jgi:hypothetical protein
MLYWISFASAQGFLGAVITEGETADGALNVVSELNLNPGGQAMIVEIPTPGFRHEAWPYRNRLLQNNEIERVFRVRAKVQHVVEAAGEKCTLVCNDCNTERADG